MVEGDATIGMYGTDGYYFYNTFQMDDNDAWWAGLTSNKEFMLLY